MKAGRGLFFVVAAVLTAGFSVLFATAFPGWFRTALLAPLMRGVFLIRFYSARLPQQLWWVVTLLLAGTLLARMALHAFGPAPKASPRGQSPGGSVDELDRLAATIDGARRHRFCQQRVTGELARLAARLISRQEGVPVDQARARLDAGAWGSDVRVQAFFHAKRRRLHRRRPRFDEELGRALDAIERYSQGGC